MEYIDISLTFVHHCWDLYRMFLNCVWSNETLDLNIQEWVPGLYLQAFVESSCNCVYLYLL